MFTLLVGLEKGLSGSSNGGGGSSNK